MGGVIGFAYNDGGRRDAGFSGVVGDCVVRAFAIAADLPYRRVYDDLSDMCVSMAPKRGPVAHPSTGVPMPVAKMWMAEHGWTWTPTMGIGTGCLTHLSASELPAGRLVARVSKHVCAVVDGVVHDLYDPSRDGSRCVYGVWHPEPCS